MGAEANEEGDECRRILTKSDTVANVSVLQRVLFPRIKQCEQWITNVFVSHTKSAGVPSCTHYRYASVLQGSKETWIITNGGPAEALPALGVRFHTRQISF